MTDKKISQDAGLAEASIDPANDLIPIVDVSEASDSDKNKWLLAGFLRRTVWEWACSDETTALTTGVKVTDRARHALKIDEVRASLTTAQTSGSTLQVDVKVNGSTIFSTKLIFDNTEKTTTTVDVSPANVLSTTTIADDDEITIEIAQIGDGTAKGLKVAILGTRTS